VVPGALEQPARRSEVLLVRVVVVVLVAPVGMEVAAARHCGGAPGAKQLLDGHHWRYSRMYCHARCKHHMHCSFAMQLLQKRYWIGARSAMRLIQI
jgi:hypothetical protein